MSKKLKISLGTAALLAVLLAHIVATGIMSDAVRQIGNDYPPPNEVGRYQIHQRLEDGAIFFDTAKGRFCVASSRDINVQTVCGDAVGF